MLDGAWLDRASAALSGFDPATVAASIGALQLDPAHAGRLYGLEAAAAAAAGLEPREGGRVPTPRVLRDLFDGSGAALGSAFEDEDPLENAFVDEIVFDGRAYRYLPGLDEEASFVLRHLCAAVLALADDPAATDFVSAARRLYHAGLAISNAVCVRAGLHRGLVPSGDLAASIRIPQGQALDDAMGAVRFTMAEAETIVGESGASFRDLAPLAGDQGPAFPEAHWRTGAPALAVPFVRAGGELVVVGPHVVAARLRHAVLGLAEELRVIARLADAFRAAVLGSVSRSLGFLGMGQVRAYGKVRLGTTVGVSGIFGFDADKVAHLLVIPDDLRPYDRADPLGTWALPGIGAAIERRLVAIEQASFHSQPWLREMLHLVVVQGVGRFFEIRHARSRLSRRSKRLVLSAANLETIALLEAGSMLRLWQFATADERLHATSAVSMFSLLDEYELWRRKEYGFYFGDGTPPSHVTILPGGAGALRREARDLRDFHGLVDPTTDSVTEVTRVSDDADIPVYFPLRKAGEQLKLVADVPSGPYWILGPVDLPAPEYGPLVKKLGEAVAYWLWQVDAELGPTGETNDVPRFAQSVHMEIEPDPWWFARGEGEDTPNAVSCTRVDAATVRLRFGSGSANLFGLQDNSGDRRLLRELLCALGENVLVDGRVQRRSLSDERVEKVLATHAPLGLKKKFFLVPAGIDPRLDQGESPSFRPVQEHDEEIQLDEVGAFVRDELGYGVGPIPADNRAEVLRRVVDSRFDVLESLVASLDPDGLLETLVEHHEAILSAQALLQLTTPTRLACFAGSGKIGAKLERERDAAAQAATATRVLIEYVAATPPSGDRPLSLATYDRLLAIISQLQQWAFTSDEIYYGLVDHPLEILPSGRLGMERGTYLTARSAFSVARRLGEMGRATRDFGRHWREAGDRSPLDDDELARATQEEFGLPLRRLVDLLWAVIAIGRQIPGAAKTVAEPALVARLAEDLGWPDVDVRTGLDLFGARQRPDFRHPAPPFRDNDADPWNYTRALSYIRKPLLVREGVKGEMMVWGNGNLYLAGVTLASLCLGGRYQARSRALQRIAGRQRERAGEEFNDEVADYFQGIGDAVVRRRFKKTGNLRIKRANGQDLGDIDILVADPATRRILAVEAKNLAGARTPVEFIGDVREVIEPQGRHSASIDKHLERIAWLHAHRREVLASISLSAEDADQWSTEALVVVNIESMAPFLVEPRIKVMSFEELKQASKSSHDAPESTAIAT